MDTELYSIRMHASRQQRHLSGAEDLVPATGVEAAAQAMLHRAWTHAPQSVFVAIDQVDTADLVRGRLSDLTLASVADVAAGRQRALVELQRAGVSLGAANMALTAIANSAGSDGVMRGAMLVDAGSGQRLEPDQSRGVRATRFGVTPAAKADCERLLAVHGLTHHRTREALVLSAKVLAAPAVIAELCWSDDPDYPAGYVASKQGGYLRIPQLKKSGDCAGGRAFFLAAGSDPASTIAFLEQTPFLVTAIGAVHRERP